MVPDQIARPDYAETGVPLSEYQVAKSNHIEVLSPGDIDKMRNVCQLAREALDIGLTAAKVGVTTDEIDRIVHEAIIERGGYPSTLNYNGYKKSCCTSINEVICHGIPDQRELKDGDILNLDVSIYKDGFHADLDETIPIGNVDDTGLKLIKTARECLEKAIATGNTHTVVILHVPQRPINHANSLHCDIDHLVKPGVLYRDIGNTIESHAADQGFSVVKTFLAHGVHRHYHCAPNFPHYARNKAVGVMKEGHVFTIEPMINEGTWKDQMWPDDWTAVTLDGKRSAQFEETMVVTKTGVEVLTARKAL